MLKTCNKCRVEREQTEFHRDKRNSDGRKGICKECVKQSDWYNPERLREKHLARKYGISEEVYQHMYDLQGGACKICDKKFSQLFVDHCHDSGKVRGLLCHRCNILLGHSLDNISTLANAITYLNEHAGAEGSSESADS